jgi:RHS repeat-associated protein
VTLAQSNPIRYRSYYYDTDTGFYYLQSRYYDRAIKRFINADSVNYLGANGDFTSLNLYAYCGNNPVYRQDSCGKYFETALDIASLVADVIDIAANPANPWAWGSLAADVASLILPGVTGGGSVVRVVAKSDKLVDLAKHTDEIFDAGKAITSSTDVGKAMYHVYDPIKDSVEDVSQKLLNKSLKKYGSRLRPDAIDFTNKIIYELKPYNKRSFNRALKQVEKYKEILGGDWIIVIDMYK